MNAARKLAALLTVAVGTSACSSGEAAEDTPRIATAEVTRGTLVIQAEATGTVEPVRSVEVKSKASGEILRLHADVGDLVAPGALLAEVDPRDVRNEYNQVQADLEVARARVEIAQSQLRRSEQLLEADVITEQEHESTRLEFANARAGLVKAETNAELAQLRLSDVTIRAPLGGTIIQKSVEEGQVIQSASQNVSGGTTLFIMANLDQMQVRTLVDETDMGEIRDGLSATVTVEAFPDRRFLGLVEKIEPQAVVEQNVTMFPVIVTLDNGDGLLKPGMNAEVNVLIDEARGVLLVPNNAVVQLADVGPAALVLGMDIESLDLRSLMRAGRGGASPGPAAADSDAKAGAATQAARRAPGMDSVRARVERGEITQDSARALMRARRQAAGGAGRPGAPESTSSPAPDAIDPDASGSRTTRPAAVFVVDPEGQPQLRMVQIGLNDWDSTEVVSGLEEGEMLAVVGAAQLQARQAEFLQNVRNRGGGSPFGGGRGR